LGSTIVMLTMDSEGSGDVSAVVVAARDSPPVFVGVAALGDPPSAFPSL
jgi:hypothetical protein